MSDYLPQEVINLVLERLPAKSLIRFTTVCKKWYEFITSPSFIATHLNHNLQQSNKNGNARILLRRFSKAGPQKGLEHPDDSGQRFLGYEAHYSLHYDNHNLDEYANFDDNFPFFTPNWYFRIIGCLNGLVCMTDDEFTYRHCTVIWNPSISRWVYLPRPIFTFLTHGPFLHVFGFGFDADKNDYKVVRIVYLQDNEIPAKVEIYRLSCGMWEDISHVGLRHEVCEKYQQAYINGVIHWVGKQRHQGWVYRYFLVSFDVGGELFGQMELPDPVATVAGLNPPDLLVFNDSLYVIHWIHTKCGRTYEFNTSFDVWLMKEYGVVESWTKLFHVDTDGLSVPLSFRQNGEILWVLWKTLVSYDPKSQRVKNLGLTSYAWKLHWRSFHAAAYVESLVLLDRKMDYMENDAYLMGPYVKCNPENKEISNNSKRKGSTGSNLAKS